MLAVRPLTAQSVLAGIVREDSTGRPLAGVEVLIERSSLRTVTNSSGRFVLKPLPAGLHSALFRQVGYGPMRVWVRPGEDTVWANPVLFRMTATLEPVVVTAEASQPRGLGSESFEERRKLGFGKFIDSVDMRRSEHLRLPDLLRRIPGIYLQWNPPSPNEHYAVSMRRMGRHGESCPMSVILDGTYMYRSVAPTAGQVSGPLILEHYDIASLESVEVYRGAAETPIEFGGASAACGTIVMWSRRH